MHSPPLLDVSLYELAIDLIPSPFILHLSPNTFKSVISSYVDLLSEQKIPAIVWAKLPKGDVWQAELDRYLTTNTPKTIYLFKSHREDAGDDTGMVSSIALTNQEGLIRQETLPAVQASVTSIQLAPNSQLRREYFLFIWSAQFRGILLAQRSRVSQIPKSTETNLSRSDSETAAEVGHEEGQEKRQLLLTLCSLDSELLQQLLERLGQAVAPLGLSEIAATEAQDSPSPPPAAINLAAHWQQRIASFTSDPLHQRSLEYLLTRQIQKQEEVGHRNTLYRKQAETAETLQLQNEELLNAIRLKDEFLNNVGQELRTPLTTIKTALSLLSSPSIKPSQRQRYMDLIAKECDRQSSLITSLLDLVQLDQMADQTTMQPIRLADVVPGVVSTYQPLAEEKGVMLAYTVPEDLPSVACVNPWLKQIVINLLHNGIKFTPRGGQVWVRAKQQGDYIQLEFRDSGIGIPQSEIPKIFDRFYRIRQSAEDASGAGLGLTIVQQLLLHCGGSISVKSKLGEGSTFNVLLPIYKSTAEPSLA